MLALREIPDGVDVYVASHDHRRLTEETASPGVELIQTRPDVVLFPNERPSPQLTTLNGVGLPD